MSDTLVVNSNGQPLSLLPLSVITWQESIKIYYLDRISVLHFYKDFDVHSPSITMAVPSVIMLKDYIKVSKAVRTTRSNVYLRDLYCCQYCSEHLTKNELTIDHVIPLMDGGNWTFKNLVTACHDCNAEKAHYDNMTPINAPRVPSYYELVEKRKKFPLVVSDETWIDYLDWDETKIRIKNSRKKIKILA